MSTRVAITLELPVSPHLLVNDEETGIDAGKLMRHTHSAEFKRDLHDLVDAGDYYVDEPFQDD